MVLYRIVFKQALIVSVFGLVLGIVFSYISKEAIKHFAPQFSIVFAGGYLLFVTLVALVIGIAASYIPVRVIAGIDPALAFKRGV